jgi:hypothetical protein
MEEGFVGDMDMLVLLYQGKTVRSCGKFLQYKDKCQGATLVVP